MIDGEGFLFGVLREFTVDLRDSPKFQFVTAAESLHPDTGRFDVIMFGQVLDGFDQFLLLHVQELALLLTENDLVLQLLFLVLIF